MFAMHVLATITTLLFLALLMYGLQEWWLLRHWAACGLPPGTGQTIAQAHCRLCEGGREQMATASILSRPAGSLLRLDIADGSILEIPMAAVCCTRMCQRRYLWGDFRWWGLNRFWIETPQTRGLVLGFAHLDPWQRVLGVGTVD